MFSPEGQGQRWSFLETLWMWYLENELMWDFDTIGVSPRRVTGNTGGNWYFFIFSQRSGEM